MTGRGCGTFVGRQTLSVRQSSDFGTLSVCMHAGPNLSAGRIPCQGFTGCGTRQRRFPIGGAAKGIPLKLMTLSVATPRNAPESILTSVESSGPGCAAVAVQSMSPTSAHRRLLTFDMATPLTEVERKCCTAAYVPRTWVAHMMPAAESRSQLTRRLASFPRSSTQRKRVDQAAPRGSFRHCFQLSASNLPKHVYSGPGALVTQTHCSFRRVIWLILLGRISCAHWPQVDRLSTDATGSFGACNPRLDARMSLVDPKPPVVTVSFREARHGIPTATPLASFSSLTPESAELSRCADRSLRSSSD